MAGVAAGVGDDAFATHWNPGAIGLLRRWQWAASYNRWFAGLTQAGFSASRLFRALGKPKDRDRRHLQLHRHVVMGRHRRGGAFRLSRRLRDRYRGRQRLDWLHRSVSAARISIDAEQARPLLGLGIRRGFRDSRQAGALPARGRGHGRL